MSKLVCEITHGVAVLKFANPPVNSFGLEMRTLLWSALARAEADAAVGAIILIGSGKGFSGGADIREFGTSQADAEPNLTTLLQGIEQCAKPVIAAIEGICVGGGLEMALACHYRVAVPNAQIALPEVKLGLLPGAGGTQRLPRVIGIEAALNMIVSGVTVRGEKLRGTSLFDVLAEGDLLTSALDFAWNLIAEKRGLGGCGTGASACRTPRHISNSPEIRSRQLLARIPPRWLVSMPSRRQCGSLLTRE